VQSLLASPCIIRKVSIISSSQNLLET